MITYGSVCSGVEAASLAWEPLGVRPAWFSEIEKFPSAVLAHHWPHVPNLGDMYGLRPAILAGLIEAPDVLVGGTPCQAFSIAGMRKGLDDARGQLTIEYVRLANAIDTARGPGRECTTVWENVEGVLSDNDNAFGCFLGALAGDAEPVTPGPRPATGKSNRWWRWNKKHGSHVPKWAKSGYIYGPQRTIAWRLLDAQYFGVAQRRRRVFVVSSARDGIDPGKILFESDGVRRDTPPSREAGQEIAGDAGAGVTESIIAFSGADAGRDVRTDGVSPPIRSCNSVNCNQSGQAPALAVAVRTAQTSANGHGVAEEVCHTLDGANGQAVAFAQNSRDEVRILGGDGKIVGALSAEPGMKQQTYLAVAVAFEPGIAKRDGGDNRFNAEICPTLRSAMGDNQPAVATALQVRRLTPIECERLQGEPDNHTRIPWRGKAPEDCPDGPRYKAVGNSKAVPVVKWLGQRLLKELIK